MRADALIRILANLENPPHHYTVNIGLRSTAPESVNAERCVVNEGARIVVIEADPNGG